MNFDSDSEVEEIKISDDLKAKFEQKQKEYEIVYIEFILD
jgi:hypothetical protein